MGRFTTRTNPAVDNFVASQLEQITDGVCAVMGRDLEAIVLTGGFGRGEGSVAVAADGGMHIVNDYDLEVVYREQWGRRLSKLFSHIKYRTRLHRLAETLARALQVKQVDLGLRGSRSYSITTPVRLADFDVKYGHQLLWGSRDPVTVMPDFQPEDIQPFEGTWLLRNRGNGLLLGRLYLTPGQLPAHKREYFFIGVNKAILAMGDALFIGAGKYRASYAHRARHIAGVIPQSCPYRNNLIGLYGLAASYKLEPGPGPEIYLDMGPEDLWRYLDKLYLAVFLEYESARLARRFSSVVEYGNWVLPRHVPSGKMELLQRLKHAVIRATSGIPPAAISLRFGYDKAVTVLFTFLLLDCYAGCDEGAWRMLERLIDQDIAGSPNRLDTLAALTREFLLLTHPSGEQGRFLLHEYRR